MKRFVSSLATLCVFVSCAFGRADIPVKLRVPNQMPGYCAWCSLETLCRHQGVKAGYDLVEKRKKDPDKIDWWGRLIPHNEGSDSEVELKLRELGIKYRMNKSFTSKQDGLDMLTKATQNGHGAVIGVRCAPGCPRPHALAVIDINAKTFEYVDSNSPGLTWEGSIEWLLWAWDGFVVVID